MPPRSRRATAAALVAAAACFVVAEAVAARGFPGYRYTEDVISDLGTARSPRAALMNTSFLSSGVLVAVATVVGTRRRDRALRCAAAVHVAGMVLIALVPSDAGSAHVVGAAAAILGGNAAAVAAGGALAGRATGFGRALVAVGGVGLLSLAMMVAAMTAGVPLLVPDAVWERGAVYPIQLAEVLLAGYLTGSPVMARPITRR
ncbi:DUF998 domain-containing protein [Mycobacterium sp. MYCO198283]|uniref:DUF998 domain-containing protein n=1 Tax=Mycobacterium sp. MYCO198283 TaxID=2883505 RepID=UPI001E33AA3D|nr:DUF998 domain-containing protein [Mycobacterium sp. MYCO198283]MCG5433130.1 DUF998 domain-containing protein [Mycobacterium sp. MYCO198283]